MITAAQAKEITKEAIATTYKQKETENIIAAIHNKAMQGKFTMDSNETDPIVADRLRLVGFRVSKTLARDQRDNDYITINWD